MAKPKTGGSTTARTTTSRAAARRSNEAKHDADDDSDGGMPMQPGVIQPMRAAGAPVPLSPPSTTTKRARRSDGSTSTSKRGRKAAPASLPKPRHATVELDSSDEDSFAGSPPPRPRGPQAAAELDDSDDDALSGPSQPHVVELKSGSASPPAKDTPMEIRKVYAELMQELVRAVSRPGKSAEVAQASASRFELSMKRLRNLELRMAVVGPEGAGKSFLVNEILQDDGRVLAEHIITDAPLPSSKGGTVTMVPTLVELPSTEEDAQFLVLSSTTKWGGHEQQLSRELYSPAALRRLSQQLRSLFDSLAHKQHPSSSGQQTAVGDCTESSGRSSIECPGLFIVRGPFPGLKRMSDVVTQLAVPDEVESKHVDTSLRLSVVDCPGGVSEVPENVVIAMEHCQVICQLNNDQRWLPKTDVFNNTLRVIAGTLKFATRPLLIATTNVGRLFGDEGLQSGQDANLFLERIRKPSKALKLASFLRETQPSWPVKKGDEVSLCRRILQEADFIPFIDAARRQSRGGVHPFSILLTQQIGEWCRNVLVGRVLFDAVLYLHQLAEAFCQYSSMPPTDDLPVPTCSDDELALIKESIIGGLKPIMNRVSAQPPDRDYVSEAVASKYLQLCDELGHIDDPEEETNPAALTELATFHQLRALAQDLLKTVHDEACNTILDRSLHEAGSVIRKEKRLNDEAHNKVNEHLSEMRQFVWDMLLGTIDISGIREDATGQKVAIHNRHGVIDKTIALHKCTEAVRALVRTAEPFLEEAMQVFKSMFVHHFPDMVISFISPAHRLANPAKVRAISQKLRLLLMRLDPEYDLLPRQLVMVHPHIAEQVRELFGAVERDLLIEPKPLEVPSGFAASVKSVADAQPNTWQKLIKRVPIPAAKLDRLCSEYLGQSPKSNQARCVEAFDTFRKIVQQEPLTAPESKAFGCFVPTSIEATLCITDDTSKPEASWHMVSMIPAADTMEFHLTSRAKSAIADFMEFLAQPPTVDHRIKLHPVFVIPEFPGQGGRSPKHWQDVNPLLNFRGKRVERGVHGDDVKRQGPLGGLEYRKALVFIVLPASDLAAAQAQWKADLQTAVTPDPTRNWEAQTIVFLTYTQLFGFDYVVDVCMLAARAFDFAKISLITSPVKRCQESFQVSNLWMNISAYRLLATLQRNLENHYQVLHSVMEQELVESVCESILTELSEQHLKPSRVVVFFHRLADEFLQVMQDPIAWVQRTAAALNDANLTSNCVAVAETIRRVIAENHKATVVGSCCGVDADVPRKETSACSLRKGSTLAGALHINVHATGNFLRLPREVLLLKGELPQPTAKETEDAIKAREAIVKAQRESHLTPRSHWQRVDNAHMAFLLRHVAPERFQHPDGGLWFDGVLEVQRMLFVANRRLTIRHQYQ